MTHVLSNLGNVAVRQGAYAEAERFYQEGLAIATALGDRSGMAAMLNGLGNVAIDQRAYEEALYCYREGLALRRALGDRWGVAASQSNLGWLAHLQGHYDEARASYEESLAIYRAIGDQRGAAVALVNLGFTLWEQADIPAAATVLYEALRTAMAIGAAPLALEAQAGVARLHARAGDLERAAELWGWRSATPRVAPTHASRPSRCWPSSPPCCRPSGWPRPSIAAGRTSLCSPLRTCWSTRQAFKGLGIFNHPKVY